MNNERESRRHFTPEQKVAALKRHLLEKIVSVQSSPFRLGTTGGRRGAAPVGDARRHATSAQSARCARRHATSARRRSARNVGAWTIRANPRRGIPWVGRGEARWAIAIG
jgi:hypothetical protein